MLDIRLADHFIDTEKIPNMSDFPKWNTSLCHAPRTWIHAKEKCFDANSCILIHVPVDRGGGIGERGIDMSDRRRKRQRFSTAAKDSDDFLE